MTQALSLHIGLNEVDPTRYCLHWHKTGDAVIQIDTGDPSQPLDPTNLQRHEFPDYAWFMVGFVGRLASCEKDAEDMCAIATSQGFQPTLLKRQEATADRVTEEIRKAATALGPGDVFLLTYAGHGSQVPDRTGEEEDEVDETWCLYDRMLLDDERYALLTEFGEGVRIIVVADCCHSGTTMRGDAEPGSNRVGPAGNRVRMMPRDAADAVYKGNAEMYDGIQDELFEKFEGEWPDVRAKVILISACRDEELAGDGDNNGAFTAALKKVWAGGDYSGTYTDFHARILAELESAYSAEVARAGDASHVNKQTPVLTPAPDEAAEDQPMAAFMAERPFSV